MVTKNSWTLREWLISLCALSIFFKWVLIHQILLLTHLKLESLPRYHNDTNDLCLLVKPWVHGAVRFCSTICTTWLNAAKNRKCMLPIKHICSHNERVNNATLWCHFTRLKLDIVTYFMLNPKHLWHLTSVQRLLFQA